MKQAVMTEPGHIVMRDVPVPSPGPDEILLRVKRIGVCGSDVHVYHGQHPYTEYPVVQGHEVSAEVVEAGSDVPGFLPGDRVTVEPQLSCGVCFSCQSGLYNLCDELKVIGFQAPGAASEFFVARGDRTVKLHPDLSHADGAMVEPLAVAVRAVGQAGDISGRNAVVLGAGPIGNLVAQTARAMGAAAVLISDVNPFRLDIARNCGVDFTVNPAREDLGESVVSHFGKYQRADVVFDCAGVSASITEAIATARKGTAIVVVAVFGEKPEIDLARLNECELRLIGTARYVIADFERAVELLRRGAISLTPLITDVIDLADYDLAYRRLQDSPTTTMKLQISVQ